jgi:hypothetical protein
VYGALHLEARQPQVLSYGSAGGSIALDEVARLGATAERLDAESTATGVDIKNARQINVQRRKCGEDGAAH